MDTPEILFKLCLLCNDNKYEGYVHKKDGVFEDFHQTKGKTWRPEKSHEKYPLHKRIAQIRHLTQ